MVKRDRVMEVLEMDKELTNPEPEDYIADRTFWIAAYQMIGISMAQLNKDKGWGNATAQNFAVKHRELVRQQMLVFCERAWKYGQKVRLSTLGKLLYAAPIAQEILLAAMKGEEYNGEQVTKTQQMVAQKWLDQLEKFTNKEADVFTPLADPLEVPEPTAKETTIEGYADDAKLDQSMNSNTN